MKEKEFLKKVIDENIADKQAVRLRAMASYGDKKARRNYVMKKGWAIAVIVILVAVAALTTMSSIYTPQKIDRPNPTVANAYSDVVKAIKKYQKMENSFNISDVLGRISQGVSAPDMENGFEDAAEKAPNNDHSKTNVQTEGMDEGDIVKTDGNYIYKINTNGCVIVEANSGNLNIISSIIIENYVPKEIYVQNNQLIMIGGIYQEFKLQGKTGSIEPMMDCIGFVDYKKTDIRIYDISDKSNPELKRQLTIEGNYYTSRLMEQEGKLFYMVNYYFYKGNEDSYIPKIIDSQAGNQEKNIPAENIYIYDDISNYSYLIIGHIDLEQPQTKSEMAAYLGLGGEIYVSAQNIFVSTYDWNSVYERNVFGWVKESNEQVGTSRIVKIGLNNLKQKAATRVKGSLKDRYSMDEYNGFLRVATTVFGNETYSNVFVLKSDLTLAGKIENIAKGERIYSVRFNKEKGSLVTFKQVDPYFSLDLSDPYKPKITGELKEDGVSYYIHYIEGTDYTIGIGMMSEVVQNPYGEFVEWTGMKVSLYDNSTGTPVNVNTYVIYGSCHSEILYNPKALLYDKDRGLLAFAYEKWTYSYNSHYYESMEQGLAVFKFDLSTEKDKDKLVYRDTLTNMNGAVNPENGWNEYYDSYLMFINRGIRIGDYIYTISDKYIKSYDLETLQKANEVLLYQENQE